MKLKHPFALLKILMIVALCSSFQFSIGEEPKTFKNPVIPGFHPDPSICRVGEDYYLVNSSFEWFPGVPIFHSKDLVNWKQIGSVLDRKSQLDMTETAHSMGIWAPTIRYHNGTFYMIVTCKQCNNSCNCGYNFYVTATDPAGPWSDPIYVDQSWGIDPTIFFDDDGKTYYVGSTHEIGGPRRWKAEDRIYIQEMDIETGKTKGEPVIVTSGHATNAMYAEGPHIYKRGKKYVLLISEGGTWENHAITVFKSNSIFGPYEPQKANPALTHRHFGPGMDITTVGHADIVKTQNGEWWAVALACRPIDGAYYLGRETFLTPMEWHSNDMVFNPGVGRILMEDKRPDLPWTPFEKKTTDNFDTKELSVEWSFLRTPQSQWWSLNEKPGSLKINLRPEKLTDDIVNPSVVARRFQHHEFEVCTEMSFNPKKQNETAGLIATQNKNFQYRLELSKDKKTKYVTLYKVFNEDRKVFDEKIVAREIYKGGDDITLAMKVSQNDIVFQFGNNKDNLKQIGDVQSAYALTSKAAGGFIGAFVGMYASSNGEKSSNAAYFNYFEYLPKE